MKTLGKVVVMVISAGLLLAACSIPAIKKQTGFGIWAAEHELTQVFPFDFLWGNQGGVLYALFLPPAWLFEGLSEYNTRKWAPWSRLITRDAVLNDRIPELSPGLELSQAFRPARRQVLGWIHREVLDRIRLLIKTDFFQNHP